MLGLRFLPYLLADGAPSALLRLGCGSLALALDCLRVEELSHRQKKTLPENNGKPWTEELDDELCRLFDDGMKRKDLCAHFGRTSGAIESRLERLGKL